MSGSWVEDALNSTMYMASDRSVSELSLLGSGDMTLFRQHELELEYDPNSVNKVFNYLFELSVDKFIVIIDLS